MRLSAEQVARYQRDGFLVVEDVLPPAEISDLRRVTDALVENARTVTAHTSIYDLEPSHTPSAPRVRRIKKPHLVDPVFDRTMRHPRIVAILRDLLGPAVRWDESKLNMKSPGYGAAVEWHQDWAFYPHTNDDLCAVGVMMDDCAVENGPLLIIPGSHKGPVYDHHVDGHFAGAMDPAKCDIDMSSAVPCLGTAGSLSIHHARAVHGSAVNTSNKPRRLLLYQYCAADAWPLTQQPADWQAFRSRLLCGDPDLVAPRLTNVPVRLPQPPAKRAGSIYETQLELKNSYFGTAGAPRTATAREPRTLPHDAVEEGSMIRLAMVSRPLSDADMRLAKQMGMTDVVTTMPGVTMAPERVQGPAWSYVDLLHLRKRVEAAGLTLSVIEGYQLSDRITLGMPGRDEDIARVCETIANMGRVGIPIYCYNFMAVFNWLRTATAVRGRGDALVTRFDSADLVGAPLTYAGETTDEQMWENFRYFLHRVLPVAEAAKVKLALHPDDPPMSPVLGLARIMRSMDAFARVLDEADSPSNGMTFCQGNFAAMGNVDLPAAIRWFGARKKLFFSHFRDVRGSVPAFEETFHDEGKTNMAACVRAYADIGYDGPMRPDHAPTMEGESNETPGYMVRGQIFAVGYMKGLIDAIRQEDANPFNASGNP